MWELLMIPSLAAMIISDFRSRTVGLTALSVTCIISVLSSIAEYGLEKMLINTVCNSAMGVFLWICIAMYLRLRKIRVTDAVGSGDIIFILGLTPMFTMKAFMYFIVISSAISLVFWIVYRCFKSGIPESNTAKEDTIPLVSTIGFCLFVHIMAHSMNIYNSTGFTF